MRPYYGYFICIGILSALLTPLYIRVARTQGWYDRNKSREFKRPQRIPTAGGWVLYLTFWLGLLWVNPNIFMNSQMVGIFIASFLVVMTGFLDDRFHFLPYQKSIGILLAAHIIYFITDISFSTRLLAFLPTTWVQPVTYLFTIGWIFLVTNAVNLLDGSDGLASSVSIVSLAVLIYVNLSFSLSLSLNMVLMQGLLLMSLLGFLPYNWYPARVYLGDTGALFIGFMYSVLTVSGLKQASFYSILVPTLLYFVPLFDTGFAVIRRIRAGKSIVKGDRRHIHHRLLQAGLKDWQVVLLMVGVTLVFSILAILTYVLRPMRRWLVAFMMILVILFTYGIMHFSQESKKHEDSKRED